MWALRYLAATGAARLHGSYARDAAALLDRNRSWLASFGSSDRGSYLMGDTGNLLLDYRLQPAERTAEHLQALIAGNQAHPARELMWGSPGTLLAALFLNERSGEPRWAHLYRSTARMLWSQLLWSPEYECHYWMQELYGQRSTYLDAVHGFVATALPLIRGRHLLEPAEWTRWEACIVATVQRTAMRDGALVNWPAWLDGDPADRQPLLMQYCHGAPGFVVCLGELPGTQLDDLLVAAGEAIWRAGPLQKGSNLCHGTGGNGYAFLKLYRRTRDTRWLERARAFAMHGIGQTDAAAARYGQLRHSLWTGDPGFAIYLWDCIRGDAAFPTLDVYFA
jgi:hypothetical protein